MAQNPPEDNFQPELGAILSTQVMLPEIGALQSTLSDLQQNNPAYQAAIQELQSGGQGYQVSADDGNVFGWSTVDTRYDGARLRASTIIQDLVGTRPGSQAAFLSVILQGERPGEDSFVAVVLEGTPGDENVQVRALGGGGGGGGGVSTQIQNPRLRRGSASTGISPAAGTFWQRFVTCLRGSCAAGCLSALAECPKASWVGFLGCVAARCGLCALKCSACSACDCSWWCKWAAGCCRP